ncbi:hypothetical protein ACIF9R_19050 [Streptomyces sp. NPDC086080]|uniref:hypothetical protein n=1 Tax=Streptomyces sp. NPDC086080 TaxID=3365748 RepID=UPI0037CDFE5C
MELLRAVLRSEHVTALVARYDAPLPDLAHRVPEPGVRRDRRAMTPTDAAAPSRRPPVPVLAPGRIARPLVPYRPAVPPGRTARAVPPGCTARLYRPVVLPARARLTTGRRGAAQ